MARTVNVASRVVRRDAFLDAAQELIQTRGYEQMSVQDVLDAVDASRGAFYHYFESKLELLEAVTERLADAAIQGADPILKDPSLPALRRLERLVANFARFKAERKELMVALVEVLNSDANALYRVKLRRMTAARVGPIMAAIIRQGTAEGVLDPVGGEDAVNVVISLIQDYQQLATEQFIARQQNRISFELVKRTYAAFTGAMERVLGAPAGSIRLVDDATLHFWFD